MKVERRLMGIRKILFKRRSQRGEKLLARRQLSQHHLELCGILRKSSDQRMPVPSRSLLTSSSRTLKYIKPLKTPVFYAAKLSRSFINLTLLMKFCGVDSSTKLWLSKPHCREHDMELWFALEGIWRMTSTDRSSIFL